MVEALSVAKISLAYCSYRVFLFYLLKPALVPETFLFNQYVSILLVRNIARYLQLLQTPIVLKQIVLIP